MPKRFECEEAPDNWIELDDVWSRREVRVFWQASGQGYIDLLQRKIVACNLVTVDGAVLANANDWTEEVLDDLPYTVFIWLTTVVPGLVMEIQDLGEAQRRRLLATFAKQPAAAAAEESPTA